MPVAAPGLPQSVSSLFSADRASSLSPSPVSVHVSNRSSSMEFELSSERKSLASLGISPDESLTFKEVPFVSIHPVLSVDDHVTLQGRSISQDTACSIEELTAAFPSRFSPDSSSLLWSSPLLKSDMSCKMDVKSMEEERFE